MPHGPAVNTTDSQTTAPAQGCTWKRVLLTLAVAATPPAIATGIVLFACTAHCQGVDHRGTQSILQTSNNTDCANAGGVNPMYGHCGEWMAKVVGGTAGAVLATAATLWCCVSSGFGFGKEKNVEKHGLITKDNSPSMKLARP